MNKLMIIKNKAIRKTLVIAGIQKIVRNASNNDWNNASPCGPKALKVSRNCVCACSSPALRGYLSGKWVAPQAPLFLPPQGNTAWKIEIEPKRLFSGSNRKLPDRPKPPNWRRKKGTDEVRGAEHVVRHGILDCNREKRHSHTKPEPYQKTIFTTTCNVTGLKIHPW